MAIIFFATTVDKIALYPYMVWDMAGITVKEPPDGYRITDIQARDAIEKYFPTVLQTHRSIRE